MFSKKVVNNNDVNNAFDEYGVNLYTRQRVEWLAGSVESLFKNDRIKVFTLDDFI